MLSWKFYWIYRSIYPKWFSRLYFMVNHSAVTPKYKRFLKSFTLQRAQTLRWLFSCFWNTNEFQMHLGGPLPLRCVQGVKHFRTRSLCTKQLCKQGKFVLIEKKVITVTAIGERGLEATSLQVRARLSNLWAPLQQTCSTCKFGRRKEKGKQSFTTSIDSTSCGSGCRWGFYTSALLTFSAR